MLIAALPSAQLHAATSLIATSPTKELLPSTVFETSLPEATSGEISFFGTTARGRQTNVVTLQKDISGQPDQFQVVDSKKLTRYSPITTPTKVREILRKEKKLQKKVANIRSDWGKIVYLRQFTRSQFPVFGDHQLHNASNVFQQIFFNSDQAAGVDSNYDFLYCGEAAIVYLNLLKYFGFSARYVVIFENYTGSESHTTVEVYVPSNKKWVVSDPTFNGYWVIGKKRLSVTQLRDTVRYGNIAQVKFIQNNSSTMPRPEKYFWGNPSKPLLKLFQNVAVYNYFGEAACLISDSSEHVPSTYYYGDIQPCSPKVVNIFDQNENQPRLRISVIPITGSIVRVYIFTNFDNVSLWKVGGGVAQAPSY